MSDAAVEVWPRRGSAFRRVALVLVGVQLATGTLAVMLSAFFAEDRSRTLAQSSLRLRLDAVAEEIEQRAPLEQGLFGLPSTLRADLADRFPDPVILLAPDGSLLERLTRFNDAPPLPPRLDTLLASGLVVVRTEARDESDTWGLTPIYDVDGLLAGGLLVQPLRQSIGLELAPTRNAYLRALVAVGLVSLLLALVLGALFALRLIRPLQRITLGVTRIGAGDYDARLETRGDDEIARLAEAVNQMAAQVQHSFETLRAADQLRRELLANVGHDLRTPLAALQGYLEETARTLPPDAPERAREMLAVADRQSRHLTRLVADLFELSILETAPTPLRTEPVPLGELLHEGVDAQRTLMRAAGVDFEADLPAGLPVIEADGTRLLRLIGNLLDNARQHSPAGGTVRLRADVAPGVVTVTVTDSGPGIPPDAMPHLFERYFRGDDARTRRSEGTGLGLAIAASVARAHGGTLTAESTPGDGATFVLTLPIVERIASADDASAA